MSLDKIKQKNPEQQAEAIAKELVKRLGTAEIAFCFRTSSGSVYAADEHVRTVRYKTVENKFQPPSDITVFLDHKYLDPQQTDRSSDQYLPNSLVHHNGHLALFGSDKIVQIRSWNDLPEGISYESVRDNLFFIVTDMHGKQMIKKVPVSFAPKVGTHPIEFCDPETHAARHRNHFGDVITDVTVTNKLPEDERRKSLENLALLSLQK
jgi:hypothetical protein